MKVDVNINIMHNYSPYFQVSKQNIKVYADCQNAAWGEKMEAKTLKCGFYVSPQFYSKKIQISPKGPEKKFLQTYLMADCML